MAHALRSSSQKARELANFNKTSEVAGEKSRENVLLRHAAAV